MKPHEIGNNQPLRFIPEVLHQNVPQMQLLWLSKGKLLEEIILIMALEQPVTLDLVSLVLHVFKKRCFNSSQFTKRIIYKILYNQRIHYIGWP